MKLCYVLSVYVKNKIKEHDAIIELGNELANRMTDHFFISTAERKKSEFKISKMLAGVAIGNVLSNMPADES